MEGGYHSTAGTIDKGAKYQFLGVIVPPERKEDSRQGPTATLLHQREQHVTNDYPA